jgi:hypothetical protein
MSNFGSGGLGGLGVGRTLLGPDLTNQLLLDQQSLIQAFMLDKLSSGILSALTWLSLCLQFEKQYFWKNHRVQAQHLLFHLGLLLMFLLTKPVAHVSLGKIMSRALSGFFFLCFLLSLPPMWLMSFFSLEGAVVVVLSSFILKVGRRVMWKELNKT